MCNIKLIGAEFSKSNLYPGEQLYIKCTFKALKDFPVSKEVKLFADFCFGHMFIDKKEETYYRVTASMYPQPAHWREGEIWSSSVIWNIPKELWGGAYKVHIGLIDADTVPIEFYVNGYSCKRHYISDINIAFNGVAKQYMKDHSEKTVFYYEPKNAASPLYNHSFDAIISVRNIYTDKETKTITTLVPNKSFSDGHISFVLKRDDSSFFVDNVKEEKGYELLYIKLPLLFTLENAKMITMYGEGRIVNPENSYPWGYEQSYWIRNIAILADGSSNILIETPFLDDKLHHSVCEFDDKKFCSVGITLTHRLRAYGELESPKVINTPTVTTKKISGRWQNCLKFLRAGITKKTDMYDRSLFYYFGVCSGPGEPAKTFDEALDHIKKIYQLTGGVKQYMLLCGWQHEGHDTGYPDVFTINKKCGTPEDLERCVKEAKKHNACMTFHDNYDDMYENNGYFDKTIAATGANGKYYSSWIWTAGVSIMTSFPKNYKTGKMQERVRKTIEMLPIDKSYHIDVLSQEVRRYDFSPDTKAAAQEVLKYKLAVIKEFEKYGITITSEGLTHPFAGKIGYAWRLNITNNKLFTDEEIIPLTAMIYHGIVPYSERNINAIIFGGNMVPQNIDNEQFFSREFFIKTLPIGLLCNEFIEDYHFDCGVHHVTYSNNSSVVYDEINDKIEVKYKGQYITKNGITLAKGFHDNEYLGYCENGDYLVKNTLGQISGIYYFNGTAIDYTVGEYIKVDCESGIPFKIIIKNNEKRG